MAHSLQPNLNPLGVFFESRDIVMKRKAHVYLSLELQHNGVSEFSDTLLYLITRIENLEAKIERMEVHDG
jgi:hypothetical protein